MAKSSMSFKMTGLKEMIDKLDKYAEETGKATVQELLDAAGEIETRSIELCPADIGELRSRAFTEMVKQDKAKGEYLVVVGYEKIGEPMPVSGKDGASGDYYAVPVHEKVEVHHDVGQAKFLEQAIKEYESEFEENFKDAYDEGAKKL